MNSSGTTSRRFLIADERVRREIDSPDRFLFRLTVIAGTSATGATLFKNVYDEYGRPGSANQGRFQYTGQIEIPELGIYHYKARLYDPGLGRFLQTDPIGYADGLNLYAYVGGDPVNATDPSGLEIDEIVVVGIRRDYNTFLEQSLRDIAFGGGFGGRGELGGGGGGGDDDRNGNTQSDDDRCDAPLPDGSTVRENVAFVRNIIFNSPRDPEGMDVPYLVAGGYVLGAVVPGGRWDYKIQPGSTGDEIGNFNFGATGSLLLPAGILARGGGVVQSIQHLVDPRGHPQPPSWLEPPNVGDDPRDTMQIMQGAGKCGPD